MSRKKIKAKKTSKKKVVQQLKGAAGSLQALSEMQAKANAQLGEAPTLSGRCDIAFNQVVLKDSQEDTDSTEEGGTE